MPTDPATPAYQLSPASKGMDVDTLSSLVGEANVGIVRRHVAAADVAEDGATIQLQTISTARQQFSAEFVANGMRIIAAGRGDARPFAIIALEDLGNMLQEVDKRRVSLVDALAPSPDLPAVRPLKIKPGPSGRLPKLAGAA